MLMLLWMLWVLLIMLLRLLWMLLIMLLLMVLMLLQLVRVVVVVEDLVLGHELHADQVRVLLPGCGVLLWVLLRVLRGVGRVVPLLSVLRVLVSQGPAAGRAGGVEEGLLGDVLVPARQPAPATHHHPAATRHVGEV